MTVRPPPAGDAIAAPARAAVAAAAVGLLAVVVPAGPATAQDGPGADPAATTRVVRSFDGEPIVTTLFLPAGASADDPVPLVLRTHGWAGSRETGGGGSLLPGTGAVGPGGGTRQALLDAGYAVLTWDQRGFGCSGGTVRVDKPGVEGRDVTALIDWAVANAPVATDPAGDPLVGMSGVSYAGGIQTAAAAVDDRIDALAPEISWADLRYSLYPGRVVNQGWAAVLYAAGLPAARGQGLDPRCPAGPQEGGLDRMITRGFTEGVASGDISPAVVDFFGSSSLAVYGRRHPVDVPTLVVQGSVDTLFDLTDGHRIVRHVRSNGAPASLLVFCGGHVACPAGYADAGDRARIDRAVLAWFDRHLRGDGSGPVRPAVTYRTNTARWRTAAGFPPDSFAAMTGSGRARLTSVPVADPPTVAEVRRYAEALPGGGIPPTPLTAAQPASPVELAAGQAATVPVGRAGAGPGDRLGLPTVRVSGTGGAGPGLVRFAKLLDRESGRVVNLQEGAVRVPLDGDSTTVEVPMPGVAYTLPAGHHLDLQVSTASTMHANARTPATARVTVDARVPAEHAGRATDGNGDQDPGRRGGPGDGDEATGSDGAGAGQPGAAADSPALPATGGGAAVLVPAVAIGLALRRRRG